MPLLVLHRFAEPLEIASGVVPVIAVDMIDDQETVRDTLAAAAGAAYVLSAIV
jgi:hypothetical protein